MTRFAYDSTSAQDIPSDAAMVCGYIDGTWKWSDADWLRFPNAVKVRIAVFGWTNDGEVGDVEDGCMTPLAAALWVRMRRKTGADPTLYVNWANWQATKDACDALGIPEPHWWLASYDNVAVIPPGTVAKQYANEPLTGGHYDLSVVADYWPGVDEEANELYVTLEAFEQYKVALEKQLNEQYVRKDEAVKSHYHDVPLSGVPTSEPK